LKGTPCLVEDTIVEITALRWHAWQCTQCSACDKFHLLVLHTKLAPMLRKQAFPLLPDEADGLPSTSLFQSNVVTKVCKAWPPRYYHNRDISLCQSAALQQSTACSVLKCLTLMALNVTKQSIICAGFLASSCYRCWHSGPLPKQVKGIHGYLLMLHLTSRCG